MVPDSDPGEKPGDAPEVKSGTLKTIYLGKLGLRVKPVVGFVPTSKIASGETKIHSYYPSPNIADRQAKNFAIGATPQFNRQYNDVKINFQRTSNPMIWGRYGIMTALVAGRGVFGDGVGPVPGSDPGLGDTQVQNTSIGHTLTLSPALLLDGVIGFQRRNQTVQGQDFGKDFATTLGIPGLGWLDVRPKVSWSKAINFADDEGWQGDTYNWLPAFSRNRAASGFDRRHVFQLGDVYALPAGRGQKFATSGVTAAYTGTPFTPSSPGGTLNLPGSAQTPDQVKADIGRPEGIGPGRTFYDTSAFAPVVLAAGERGRFGSMGRNSLRNPGVLRTDLALSKTFNITETVNLRCQAEANNATNSRLSTGFASTDVTNANFLRVLSTGGNGLGDERQFRMSLRLGF